VQWEDLSKDTAFTVLTRYRKVIPSFNDDIQGTGAVALAGVLSACKLMGRKLTEQRIVVYGAGAGGAGVAWALRDAMVRQGLSMKDATDRLFVLDSKGLLLDTRKMEDYKQTLWKSEAQIEGWQRTNGAAPDLLQTIEGCKATVLLGLSGQPGTFTEQHAKALLKFTDRPVIFPLSNPTSSCEATPADLLRWSGYKAIVATGSPFLPVELPTGGTQEVGQGNNAFIFPGLGFGAILANAREVTDNMVMAAAMALADYTAEKYVKQGLIYPPISDLREVSTLVATKVIAQAFEDGVAQTNKLTPATAEKFVRDHFWRPRYLPFVKG